MFVAPSGTIYILRQREIQNAPFQLKNVVVKSERKVSQISYKVISSSTVPKLDIYLHMTLLISGSGKLFENIIMNLRELIIICL